MKPKLSVAILVTVPKPEHFDACTLCFDTLRTGFPTANIKVFVNDSLGLVVDAPLHERLRQKLYAARAEEVMLAGKVHHAEWIRTQVNRCDGPLVILDADTVFWKSCEDWTFPEPVLLAGYYVPAMVNDFARCVSFPRLHTSHLWFPNPARLRQHIYDAYPPAQEAHGEYCPCDPFMPAVRFMEGRPYFWDSCANLYGMLASVEFLTYAFEPEHLACYAHLNSAAFYDCMLDRLHGDKEAFAYIHRFAASDPAHEALRNLWPHVNAYYAERASRVVSK